MMTSSATASGATASWASLASVSSSSPFATEQNSDGPSAHTFAVTPVSAFEDVQSYNREPATFDYDVRILRTFETGNCTERTLNCIVFRCTRVVNL